jgi:flagella basal body P-ring formation protein FlgA
VIRLWSIVVLVLGGLTAAASGQGAIVLRGQAAVPPGEPVLLRHIALLQGADAEALGDVELSPPSPRGGELSIEDVRSRLNAAKVNWSRLTLRGGTCRWTPAAPPPPSPAPPASEQSGPTESNSVRAAVERRIAQILQVEPTELRLSFAGADEDILKLTVTGRTLEIKPTGASDRLPLALTLYEHDRIVASKTIRVGVLVQREVAIAAVAKRRGETINEEDVTFARQWLGPTSVSTPREQVIGAAVRNRLAPGELITESLLTPAHVVNKGDQVLVRVVSGTVVLTTRARALAAAKDGEIVELQAVDGSNRTFSARMDGRGRAVLVATQATDTIRGQRRAE